VFGPKTWADKDPRQDFGSMDYDIWAEVLRVNLMAPMKMSEVFVEHVAASAQKKIVAISSTEGSSPNAKGGIYAYRTSKAALNMLTRTAAGEYAGAHGIFMTAVDTGWINEELPRARQLAVFVGVSPRAGVTAVLAGVAPAVELDFASLSPSARAGFRRSPSSGTSISTWRSSGTAASSPSATTPPSRRCASPPRRAASSTASATGATT
jgi:NAD(P)-dependent dehydrogenase (short-subunit alcohol dehydrogenase family)